MGGRIETATAAGQGTCFKLVLPLTTAVTQVVMLRCGDTTVAVPSTLVEIVRRATPDEVDAAPTPPASTRSASARCRSSGSARCCRSAPGRPTATARTRPVVVIRSAQQRIALHVDEVLGNQEVVVKNLGPQLSRLPGLAGMTLLASGAVALIYNPVALATLYGETARDATHAALRGAAAAGTAGADGRARRRAAGAAGAGGRRFADGAPRHAAPAGARRLPRGARQGRPRRARAPGRGTCRRSCCRDIEMPRMDGFDLVRNMRADARCATCR